MRPRDAYETFVGTGSNMGIGDWQEFLSAFLSKKAEAQGVEMAIDVSPEEAEQFLRDLSEQIADEDEFDDEDSGEVENLNEDRDQLEDELNEDEDEDLDESVKEMTEGLLNDEEVEEL